MGGLKILPHALLKTWEEPCGGMRAGVRGHRNYAVGARLRQKNANSPDKSMQKSVAVLGILW